ncbi:MAG: hypothetical protein U0T83_03380 [Bacteriovoracaceae bacterium]
MINVKSDGVVTLEANICTGSSFDRKQIAFDQKSGLILEVGALQIPFKSLDYQFNDDTILFPAFGDIHVHAREDVSQKNIYKEDFKSISSAAINGGVVLIGDMPNNPIPPVNETTYLAKLNLTKSAPIAIFLYAGVGPKSVAFKEFKVPYKVYMGPSIGDLFFKDKATLFATLKNYQGQTVSFHCEDPDILEKNRGASTHELRRPKIAELMSTIDALEFIEKFNLKGKLCHYSIGEGLPLIRKARERGLSVEMEVTPQHLYYSMEKMQELNFSKEQIVEMQMNPPLRSEEDRHQLLEAFRKGEIDYLATDHAPHAPDEKTNGISGLTGLDTYGSVVSWLIQKERVDPKVIAKACSEKPGEFFNQFLDEWKRYFPEYNRFGKGIGKIAPGYSANFSLLNLNLKHIITKNSLYTKAKSSPFLNREFPGRVEKVFLLGREITP